MSRRSGRVSMETVMMLPLIVGVLWLILDQWASYAPETTHVEVVRRALWDRHRSGAGSRALGARERTHGDPTFEGELELGALGVDAELGGLGVGSERLSLDVVDVSASWASWLAPEGVRRGAFRGAVLVGTKPGPESTPSISNLLDPR